LAVEDEMTIETIAIAMTIAGIEAANAMTMTTMTIAGIEAANAMTMTTMTKIVASSLS
jgi:hypothetical protein